MTTKSKHTALMLLAGTKDPMVELGVALGVMNAENDEKLKAGLSGEDYRTLRQATTAMVDAFRTIRSITTIVAGEMCGGKRSELAGG